MNHKFGDCTHFLTVTPDEENGIEIQAYSSVDIDISDTKKISEMSKEELQKKVFSEKDKLAISRNLSILFFTGT